MAKDALDAQCRVIMDMYKGKPIPKDIHTEVETIMDYCEEHQIEALRKTKQWKSQNRIRTQLIGQSTWLKSTSDVLQYVIFGFGFIIAGFIQQFVMWVIEPTIYALFHVSPWGIPPSWFRVVLFVIEAVIFFLLIILISLLNMRIIRKYENVEVAKRINEIVTHQKIEKIDKTKIFQYK